MRLLLLEVARWCSLISEDALLSGRLLHRHYFRLAIGFRSDKYTDCLTIFRSPNYQYKLLTTSRKTAEC